MALDTVKIAHAALDLLNECGLEALSTRRLAAVLNVKSPALYKHFRNKAELMDHMATAMLRDAFVGLDRDVPWADWVRGIAYASRASMACYRDGARLLLVSSPSAPLRSQIIAFTADPLINVGFAPPLARHALATLASFVIGWMLNEQNDATQTLMKSDFGDTDKAFARSVEIIVEGIAARHAHGADFQGADYRGADFQRA